MVHEDENTPNIALNVDLKQDSTDGKLKQAIDKKRSRTVPKYKAFTGTTQATVVSAVTGKVFHITEYTLQSRVSGTSVNHLTFYKTSGTTSPIWVDSVDDGDCKVVEGLDIRCSAALRVALSVSATCNVAINGYWTID